MPAMHAMRQSAGPGSAPRPRHKQRPGARPTAESLPRRTAAEMARVELNRKQAPQRQEETSDNRHTDNIGMKIKQNAIDNEAAKHGDDIMERLRDIGRNLAD